MEENALPEYSWPEAFTIRRPDEVENFVEREGLRPFLVALCPALEKHTGLDIGGEVSVFRSLDAAFMGDAMTWLVIELEAVRELGALAALHKMQRIEEEVVFPLYRRYPEAEARTEVCMPGIPEEMQEHADLQRYPELGFLYGQNGEG